MSLSKPAKDGSQERKGSGLVPSSLYNTPIISERFDRFCTNCSGIIENMALEKYSGMKCVRCDHEVEFLDKADGLYRMCVRCCAFLRCTAVFCHFCGRRNQHYDPEKPARLEKAAKLKLREEIRKELDEGQSLSQLFVNDGDFPTSSGHQKRDSEAGAEGHKKLLTEDRVEDDKEGN